MLNHALIAQEVVIIQVKPELIAVMHRRYNENCLIDVMMVVSN